MDKDEKKVVIKVDEVEFPEFKAIDSIGIDKDKFPMNFNFKVGRPISNIPVNHEAIKRIADELIQKDSLNININTEANNETIQFDNESKTLTIDTSKHKMEGLVMKELVLNKCKNENGTYFGLMTFGYFRYLIENNIININDIVSMHNTPENIAFSYNENTDTSKINEFQIDLITIKNTDSILSLTNEDLIVKSESIDILDGQIRAKIILNLQERFMDNLLRVRLHVANSVNEAQNLVIDMFKQVKIKQNDFE